MIKKLQHLTIVTMAIRSKVIPYKDLLVELDIKNVRDLEDLIIESIYAGRLNIIFTFSILENLLIHPHRALHLYR